MDVAGQEDNVLDLVFDDMLEQFEPGVGVRWPAVAVLPAVSIPVLPKKLIVHVARAGIADNFQDGFWRQHDSLAHIVGRKHARGHDELWNVLAVGLLLEQPVLEPVQWARVVFLVQTWPPQHVIVAKANLIVLVALSPRVEDKGRVAAAFERIIEKPAERARAAAPL